ncbi:hypothetical protein BJ508DRAFT_329694 [Ascobolus immersus RN42]|uniref:Uncharacterized protein n=1 Tax=Ascobolus immersus RN42 TaxID=1160509 RepID=A0A3N4HVU7_ASCIM|nr:hypothetical protein BJ508DRAFT_329694 [Ascobolus immersus RN42]
MSTSTTSSPASEIPINMPSEPSTTSAPANWPACDRTGINAKLSIGMVVGEKPEEVEELVEIGWGALVWEVTGGHRGTVELICRVLGERSVLLDGPGRARIGYRQLERLVQLVNEEAISGFMLLKDIDNEGGKEVLDALKNCSLLMRVEKVRFQKLMEEELGLWECIKRGYLFVRGEKEEDTGLGGDAVLLGYPSLVHRLYIEWILMERGLL